MACLRCDRHCHGRYCCDCEREIRWEAELEAERARENSESDGDNE